MVLGRPNADGIQTIDLKDLQYHADSTKGTEHDASLTRNDAYWGDNHSFNSTLWSQMKSFSTDGKYLTLRQMAKYRNARESDCQKNNPQYQLTTAAGNLGAWGEVALLSLALSDSTGNVPIAWADMVFTQEKLPVELGWAPRPISGAALASTIAAAKWDSAF
ncbi:hypothetical protein HDU76_013635 [Blyttiomyces sp. JEL0837]|nr:hypothetical protein HDU76_013635 [Blyttiomyces sp. JEL0837]